MREEQVVVVEHGDVAPLGASKTDVERAGAGAPHDLFDADTRTHRRRLPLDDAHDIRGVLFERVVHEHDHLEVLVGLTLQTQERVLQRLDAAALGALAAVTGTGQGRSYVDMALKDAAGTPLTVESFAGKRLLINFWASWCVPCREEMPALDALAAKFNSENFMVLPVNTGETDPAKGAAFLAENAWANLPLYQEANSFEIINRLKTSAVSAGLPATVLVDEKGCELAVLQGPAEWDSPDGHNLIEVFLGLVS